jgi:hypothetical protein
VAASTSNAWAVAGGASWDACDQELLEQPLQVGALTVDHGEQFMMLDGG